MGCAKSKDNSSALFLRGEPAREGEGMHAKIAHAEATVTMYLPMTIDGSPVLEHQGGIKWKIVDEPGKNRNVRYRMSKQLSDKSGSVAATFGSVVQGVDTGDGWLVVENPEVVQSHTKKQEVQSSNVDVHGAFTNLGHAGSVEIMVYNIGGDSSTVRTQLSNRVADFKDELERQGALLYSARQTELVLGSDVLKDMQVLGDLCLEDGAMITALLRLEKLFDKNEIVFGDNPHSRANNAFRGEAIM